VCDHPNESRQYHRIPQPKLPPLILVHSFRIREENHPYNHKDRIMAPLVNTWESNPMLVSGYIDTTAVKRRHMKDEDDGKGHIS
jgi:hypothetical protein